MNEQRVERALRAGPPFASSYQPVPLRLEPGIVLAGSPPRRIVLLAAVGLVIASIVVLFTLGAQLITRPDTSLGPCPRTFDEADAVDTSGPGLTQAERAWPAQPAAPAARNGAIAVFAWRLPDVPLAVETIDPTTGRRCRLVTFSREYQITHLANTLDWAPGGDALAIGLDGQLFLWTPGRLLRIWTSDRFPHVDWAPDGASITVWQGFTGDGVGAGVPNPGVRLIFADGRPDRTFVLDPEEPGTMDLRRSPDGTRWAISRDTGTGVGSPSELRLVTVADGSESPLDLGLTERTYHVVGWLDDERVLVRASIYGPGPTQYHVVPVSEPSAYTTLALRDEFAASSLWRPRFSPDLSRLVMSSSDIGLVVVDARSGERTTLVRGSGTEAIGWAPDGEQLVFQTDDGIFTVDATGTGLRQVATGSLVLVGDSWQPEASR